MAAKKDGWRIWTSLDVLDRSGKGVRLECQVACSMGVLQDAPVVGRFRTHDGRRLDYLGHEGRAYVPAIVTGRNEPRVQMEGDHVARYPETETWSHADLTNRHAITGTSIADDHYVEAEPAHYATRRFAVGRRNAADAFLDLARTGRPFLEPAVLGEAEFDAAYDPRDEDLRICMAAKSFIVRTLAPHVAGLPADVLRSWKSLADLDDDAAHGMAGPACELLGETRRVMDHAEAAGIVNPKPGDGSEWSMLRARIEIERDFRAIPPSLAPTGPRP